MHVNNGEVHFDFEHQFEAENEKSYASGFDEFQCVECGHWVDLNDSYSDKGKHLICRKCLEKLIKEMNVTPFNFLKKYIWRNSEHET